MSLDNHSGDYKPPVAYPWQNSQWQRLSGLLQAQKLPHALMLTGPKGTGKLHFANSFAALLLCLSPVNQVACGRCKGCELVRAGTHPDQFLLRPEDKSKVIKIDQVRKTTEFLAQTGQQGGHKVAIIEPVEALNANAANALLKSLEEPAGQTTLLLVCHAPSQVMATIRSRCQWLEFPLPERRQSLQWLTPLVTGHDPERLLQCAAGAPVAARELLDGDLLEQRQDLLTWLMALGEGRMSALEVAAKAQVIEPLQTVEWLLQWVQNGIRLSVSKGSVASIQKTEPDDGQDDEQGLLQRVSGVDGQIGFRFLDKLMQLKRQLLSSVALNKQLLLEELMMDWQALMRQSVLSQ